MWLAAFTHKSVCQGLHVWRVGSQSGDSRAEYRSIRPFGHLAKDGRAHPSQSLNIISLMEQENFIQVP
jgi:hypothetical protein